MIFYAALSLLLVSFQLSSCFSILVCSNFLKGRQDQTKETCRAPFWLYSRIVVKITGFLLVLYAIGSTGLRPVCLAWYFVCSFFSASGYPFSLATCWLNLAHTSSLRNSMCMVPFLNAFIRNMPNVYQVFH